MARSVKTRQSSETPSESPELLQRGSPSREKYIPPESLLVKNKFTQPNPKRSDASRDTRMTTKPKARCLREPNAEDVRAEKPRGITPESPELLRRGSPRKDKYIPLGSPPAKGSKSQPKTKGSDASSNIVVSTRLKAKVAGEPTPRDSIAAKSKSTTVGTKPLANAPRPAKKHRGRKHQAMNFNDNSMPSSNLDEILAVLDQRKFTKLDKQLRDSIHTLEATSGLKELQTGMHLFELERSISHKMLNCHSVLYWRFRTLWEQRHHLEAHPGREGHARESLKRCNVSPSSRVMVENKPNRILSCRRLFNPVSIVPLPPKDRQMRSPSPAKSRTARSLARAPSNGPSQVDGGPTIARKKRGKSPAKALDMAASVLSPLKSGSSQSRIPRPLRPRSQSPARSSSESEFSSLNSSDRQSSVEEPAPQVHPEATTGVTHPPISTGKDSKDSHHTSQRQEDECFQQNFHADHEYGQYLRRVEQEAYVAMTLRRVLAVLDHGTRALRQDFIRAQQIGCDRARHERNLRSFGDRVDHFVSSSIHPLASHISDPGSPSKSTNADSGSNIEQEERDIDEGQQGAGARADEQRKSGLLNSISDSISGGLAYVSRGFSPAASSPPRPSPPQQSVLSSSPSRGTDRRARTPASGRELDAVFSDLPKRKLPSHSQEWSSKRLRFAPSP